ncbi:MAG: DUF1841 family protein [Chromatiaceae bacterium]|jgi:hypothetical protein
MFTPDRSSMRRFFIDAWKKACAGEPLEALERQIAEVVRQHPEYHGTLTDADVVEDKDFPPEAGQTNPFLHLGLHLAILEQITTDRPAGVRALYQRITAKATDTHQAEHEMMDCLALGLWEAQRAGRKPDETAYLECLRRLTAAVVP